MNQMDEMAKIQKKVVKIEEIRKMHKAAKEKSNQVTIFLLIFLIDSSITIIFNNYDIVKQYFKDWSNEI